MEIERKFIIKDLSTINLQNYEYKDIIQDYLYKDNFTAVRKRKVITKNMTKYYYTIKTNKVGISVNEIEREIDEKQYNALLTNSLYHTIQKRRYIIPYINNLCIELDVFEGCYKGIIFAEIEYTDESQAKSIPIPNWFDKEISTSLTNSDMATLPINQVLDMYNNL